MLQPSDTLIHSLGPCNVTSPLKRDGEFSSDGCRFVSDQEKIRYRVEIRPENESDEAVFFEKAGPREKIFYEPLKISAAIVTCGGLSPGLNNVIRSLVYELKIAYGVHRVFGIYYGYSGFSPTAPHQPRELELPEVREIHKLAGSIIGSSRGPVAPSTIVDCLVSHKIDMLFCIGGDGTQRGAHSIVEEISRRDLAISVIGIPKTIDNDVPFVYQSFGFVTAVEKARDIILAAAIEARSYRDTIAIVKLMGRDTGFISTYASLAAQEADFTLIPEVPFELQGETGLLSLLEQKLQRNGSAVIVVSEGAGQNFFQSIPNLFDPSGNRLQHDIGLFLKERILEYAVQKGLKLNIRYFDPSYSVRAVPANVSDAFYCDHLARAAVHAAMAGKTDTLIGLWYNNLTHVPIPLVNRSKKRIQPSQEIWRSLLESTGQPAHIGNNHKNN